MLKIKLDYVDELNLICADLCVVTYLEGLFRQDRYDNFFIGKFDFIQNSTERYLWDKQKEIVFKLKDLLEKQDFTVSIK